MSCTSLVGLEGTYFAGTWCASQPSVVDAGRLLFCDDFDDGGALGAGWTGTSFTNKEWPGLSTDDFRSKPNAFRIGIPPVQSEAGERETLEEQVASISAVTFAFDFKPELHAFTGDDGIDFHYAASLDQRRGDRALSALSLRVSPGEMRLQQQIVDPDPSVADRFIDSPYAPNAGSGANLVWTRVTLACDFEAPPTAVLTLEFPDGGAWTLTQPLDPSFAPNATTFHLGDIYFFAAPDYPFTLLYDNVTLYAR